jgi:tRNA splicing endonuclease
VIRHIKQRAWIESQKKPNSNQIDVLENVYFNSDNLRESSARRESIMQFRRLRSLGTELAEVESKISEILVGEVEEEVYHPE